MRTIPLSLVVVLRLQVSSCVLASASQHNDQAPKRRPNFVIVLTDDLDFALGGWKTASTLAKTRALIANEGMVLPNWFAQTPVCCPSRAELLTGRYFHNLWTPNINNNNPSCMHVDVDSKNTSNFYQEYYFAKYFEEFNYTVGLFGKHLNSHNPTNFIPNGVDIMLVNNGGSYLNPEFTWATRGSSMPPELVNFDNCTNAQGLSEPCYTTSVVGNASLAWIQRHLAKPISATKTKQPFFALISVKAPHVEDGPVYATAIPAPWYENTTIAEQAAPKTMNYNQSCPNHHWLVRTQAPMTPRQANHVNGLYQSRLRTLLSVDDLVEELIDTLKEHNELDNTYIVFTSDNGYQLGQFRMPSCKFNPYEDDIRIPMMIRGPGILPFSTRNDIIATHVDLMPTLLGLASTLQEETRDVPSTMDGINLASRLLNPTPVYPARRVLLIEYKSLGDKLRVEHLVDTFNHTFEALRILDSSAPIGFRNIKYIQFRDSRIDWNSTNPPLEQELFDLDLDPYELTNLAVATGGDKNDSRGSASFLNGLSTMLTRMSECQGKNCREEQVNLGHCYTELIHQTLHQTSEATLPM